LHVRSLNRLVEVGLSWTARAEKVDGCVLEQIGFSQQGTDSITSHQDWRDILAQKISTTDEILSTVLTVSIYGHSKDCNYQHHWPEHGFWMNHFGTNGTK